MGVQEQIKEVTELLKASLPEDKHEKLIAGVQALADQIRTQVNEELAEEHEDTRSQIERLVEQRDTAIRRAQDAETKNTRISGDAGALLEQAKASVQEEYEARIKDLEARIEQVESEKDELDARISERYEELRVSDREKIVEKLDEFLEIKTGEIRTSLCENAALSGDTGAAALAFHEIASICRRLEHAAQADAMNDPEALRLQEANAALTAQVRQLESRNVRLMTECTMLRERAEDGLASSDDSEKEVTPAVAGGDDVDGDSSTPRASDLLREAFASEAAPAGKGSAEGWLDDSTAAKQSREERLQIAESVTGSGIQVQDTDLVRETTENAASRADSAKDQRLVPGTDLTLSEAKVLCGI